MKIYLAGQTNFGNRGCEALVRSTSLMINKMLPVANIVCPLNDPLRDGQQWSSASDYSVRFIKAPVFSKYYTFWHRTCRVLPFVERWGIPSFPLDRVTSEELKDTDYMIMTGGDILSLDYGVPSLYVWSSFVEKFIDQGIPTILWAASVGPFTKVPHVEKAMLQHLKKYTAITVRETVSYEYLKSLGLENVDLVADPAFNLEKETDVSFPFSPETPVLGVNVSPLIRKWRESDADKELMDAEVVTFLKNMLAETDYSILLIPHVGDLGGSEINSDYAYMKSLLNHVEGWEDRIKLLPDSYNAAQLKHIISLCQFFIGARTHSTIAALSMGVPTISIGYSVKATGINQDLFGHTRYVLNTPEVSAKTLKSAFLILEKESTDIKQTLMAKVPEFKENAYQSVVKMMQTFGEN